MALPGGDGDLVDGIGDLLDHVIVLNERHFKRPMNDYILYYHDDRIHLALDKRTPASRGVEQHTNPSREFAITTSVSFRSWPVQSLLPVSSLDLTVKHYTFRARMNYGVGQREGGDTQRAAAYVPGDEICCK